MNRLKSWLGWPIALSAVAGLVTFVILRISFGQAEAADIDAWQLFASAAGAFGVLVCGLALSAIIGILRLRVSRSRRP